MTKPDLPESEPEAPESEVGLAVSVFPKDEQTRPDIPSTLPPPPEQAEGEKPGKGEKKLRCHKCCHKEAVVKETVLEGTAPGRWEPCGKGEEGAFCDPEGRWQRWRKTGREKKFSAHVHKLAPGDAKRISHVTTRFGMLPQNGVVQWSVDEDGNLVVRPALDHDLDLQVHLDDDGVQDG